MKTQIKYTVLLNCINVFLVAAIGFSVAGCKQSNTPAPLSKQEKTALETEWALSLPSDVTLLVSDDDGGRDSHYYNWFIFSKSSIALSPDKVPSPSGHIPNDSIKDTVTFFQSIAPHINFASAVSATTLSWSTNAFNFRGNLLRTSNGDYLYVQRFRKSSTTSAP